MTSFAMLSYISLDEPTRLLVMVHDVDQDDGDDDRNLEELLRVDKPRSKQAVKPRFIFDSDIYHNEK